MILVGNIDVLLRDYAPPPSPRFILQITRVQQHLELILLLEPQRGSHFPFYFVLAQRGAVPECNTKTIRHLPTASP